MKLKKYSKELDMSLYSWNVVAMVAEHHSISQAAKYSQSVPLRRKPHGQKSGGGRRLSAFYSGAEPL